MIRAPRQDDVAGRGVAAHVDFRAFETVFGRQADGLAAAIAEEFGGLCHDIYHDKDRQTLPQWPQPGRPPAFRIPFRRLGSLRAPRLRDRRRHPVSAPESWQDLFELMNMIEVPRDLLADRKDAHPQKRELF